MPILILALVAIVFFVTGIAMIFKSYGDIPEADKIVPLEEASKLQADLDSSHQEEEILKLKLDSLVLELDKAKTRLVETGARGQEADELKSQIQNYENRIKELAQLLEYLRSKADQQAQQAVEVLTSMQHENEDLKVAAQEAERRADPAILAQFQNEKKTLEDRLQDNLAKLTGMEQELVAARSQGTAQTEATQKVVSDMKQQNDQLHQEMTTVNARIADLQAALTKEREDKERELKNAQASVAEFKARMDDLAREKSANEQNLSQLQTEVDRNRKLLKQTEQTSIVQVDVDRDRLQLEKNLEDLKVLNVRFQSREKLLQQELTKNRAQVMGLEKICADFKNQLNKTNNP